MPSAPPPAQPPAQLLADDLWFPEGPIAQADGSCLLVEIRRQTLSRIAADGSRSTVAELGGGPNGAAIGPDGWVYVCNNGGFAYAQRSGVKDPVPAGTPADYAGGCIQRVNPATGEHSLLLDQVNGRRLRGPNDLVFDAQGGFWFTDMGKNRPHDMDHGGLYYARADGSDAREVVFPLVTPNGVGLSPDGRTLYVAETATARLWAWPISEPGRVNGPARLLYVAPKAVRFDSMAVEACGNICVATLGQGGGITVIAPDGGLVEEHPINDLLVTNICFGGADLRTAYITVSGAGELITLPWPRPGLALNY